jgi:putative glutamine amidotransferase
VQPLIGITTASIIGENGLTYNRMYNAVPVAVAKAGGLPVLIPTGIDESALRAIYERLDAVLLPGGPDLDPSYYGEDRHPTTNVDPARDAIEIPLARWAYEDDLPMFGICRGHQVINVALGGTLVQDLPSQWQQAPVLTHDLPNEQPRSTRLHDIQIQANSRLASIIGDLRIDVNSLHHQAVQHASPHMRVVAHAPDGVVEATEVPDRRFMLTVQWHPEDLQDNEAMQRLFRAFVEAASVRR